MIFNSPEGSTGMAEETTVVLTDDLESSLGKRVEGAQRHFFSYDGKNFQIDLTPENKAAMDAAMQPYVDAATRLDERGQQRAAVVPGGRRGGRKSRAVTDRERDRAQGHLIREWAVENWEGTLSPRGRIPNSVKQAYAIHVKQKSRGGRQTAVAG